MRVKNVLSIKTSLVVLFLIGFVFRVFLFAIARHGDINNNISWGEELLMRGPINFYEGLSWTFSAPNQPPLYLYLFGCVALVISSISSLITYLNGHVGVFPSSLVWWWSTNGELLMAKIPSILSDLGIAFILYRFFEDKRKGLLAAFLWIVNPVVWYNSSIWGGTDSIVNLFGLLSFYFLFKKNITKSAAFLVISILFKGSLALFIPLWFIVVFYQKYKIRQLFWAVTLMGLITILVSYPFHPSLDLPVWLFNLYTQRFFPGEIGSLTANAFNFWWIVDPGKTLDSITYFGLSARNWGFAALVSGYVIILSKIKKHLDVFQIVFAISILALISFLFMTRIHERYLYPMFPYLTIYSVQRKWARLPLAVFSLINLANLYHLFWAPGIDTLKALYLNSNFALNLSVISILVFVVLFIGFLTMKPSKK